MDREQHLRVRINKMTYTSTEKGYIIILTRGEKLIETLTSLCENENIHSGVFQAIGAIENPELGYYNIDTKEYKWQSMSKMLEIVSLTGNVSLVDSKPFLHIHCVLSDDEFKTVGGHLKEGAVGATCEIYLTNFGIDIKREFDEEVGLKLLSISKD